MWKSHRALVQSSLPQEECVNRLNRATRSEPVGIDQWTSIASGEAHTSGIGFIGRTEGSTFNVRLLTPTANSFHPRLHGKLEAAPGGTECRTSLGFPLPVRAFVAVVSVFLAAFGAVAIVAGYPIPGIAALVILGLLWVVVGVGVSQSRREVAQLMESFVTLLNGDLLPG